MKTKRLKIKRLGVIFDMDGVLVDSSAAHLAAWNELGRKIGRSFSTEFFNHTFGMHNREILPLWLGAELSLEEVERLSEAKEAMVRAVARDAMKPIDGAVELVEALAADGFLLAVGSSGPLANVELMLELLGVSRRFAALATGDDVRHGKPHPEVFLKAAGKLGLPPGACAVIEDAPPGVQAARAAGATVIAVTTSRAAAELGEADLIVESLRRLAPPQVRELILRPRTAN